MRIISLLLCACGLCCLRLAAQSPADSLLAVRLDSLVEHGLPRGSSAGMAVYDLTEGRMLYERQADGLCRPASTMKLATAIAALAQPGFDEPFRTEIWAKGRIEGDTLHGDLYVVGGFDPELGDADLDSLVSAVARAPFSVIKGRVLGDVSMKDSLYWGSGWLWDDNPAAFQPYLSPLMLEKGTARVTVSPTQPGDTAGVSVRPASSYYTVNNTARTRTPSAGPLRVTRRWMENGNEILVSGNVAKRQTRALNLYSSQDFFMHTFAERLAAAGIRRAGTAADSLYAFGELSAPDSLCVLLAAHETPAQHVLDEMLKESDNLNAEAMFCRLGAQYTGRKHVRARDGQQAVRELIGKVGLRPSDYRLADGCGLSHYDYLSPRLLVAFLRYAYARTDIFGKLYKALPVSGVDGTLKRRMGRGTPAYRRVHAKTGSYTGINCLAGYLQARDGHWLAFAIMNQNVLSGRKARAFQDKVCVEIIMRQGN